MSKLIDTLFSEWIDHLQRTEPPFDDVTAFNFGVFESPDGFRLYLSGAKEYDADNEDWACANDYYPNGRYFQTLLAEDKWEDALETAVRVVRNFLTSSNLSSSFLQDRIVTVGFDDGNLTRIQ